MQSESLRGFLFFARGAGAHGPRPTMVFFCRAGPACPAGRRWLSGGGLGAARPTHYMKVRESGASGKSAKRRQWRKKRADFEEVPRLAATTVAGNRLARRWATAAPYGWVTSSAVGRADVGIGPYDFYFLARKKSTPPGVLFGFIRFFSGRGSCTSPRWCWSPVSPIRPGEGGRPLLPPGCQ